MGVIGFLNLSLSFSCPLKLPFLLACPNSNTTNSKDYITPVTPLNYTFFSEICSGSTCCLFCLKTTFRVSLLSLLSPSLCPLCLLLTMDLQCWDLINCPGGVSFSSLSAVPSSLESSSGLPFAPASRRRLNVSQVLIYFSQVSIGCAVLVCFWNSVDFFSPHST